MEKVPSVQDLKLYANNLLAAENKIGGNANIVSKGGKSKNLTCKKCKNKGHEESTCRVRVCEHCGKTGYITETCFTNPSTSSFRGPSSSSSSFTSGSSQVIQPPPTTTTTGVAHIIYGNLPIIRLMTLLRKW